MQQLLFHYFSYTRERSIVHEHEVSSDGTHRNYMYCPTVIAVKYGSQLSIYLTVHANPR
jgi:hypothetical protein